LSSIIFTIVATVIVIASYTATT